MRKNLSFRDFDWVLLGFTMAIAALGVLQIYSASLNTKFADATTGTPVHIKQMYWLAAGILVMFAISRIDYHLLLENAHWAYVGSIVSLLAVAAIGIKILGAKRWIRVPGLGLFQPSEWVKLVLIIVLARYISSLNQKDVTWPDIFKAGLIAGIPFLLVVKQPDLGTSLTYLPPLVVGLFLGGIRFKQIAVILLAVAMVVPVAWKVALKPYQKDRLVNFTHPENDPKGSGYQIQQSLIAVGNGGLFGRGVAGGTQTQGMFLPVTHTDFIFAAFAEEHGFVGATAVLLLYFIVLMRLIQNAQTAPDRAGTMITMGVVAVLVFHILVNIGMVVGMMPVTGIPLPLMSYGGSSVMFTFLALGIVMNIHMRRFVN
ncbi:MAG: cell elongation-specific peptidoglycan biosynthesis regulator RodA [Acidobacteriales bacterium]|nr:cell elongation-specific peptidoglycan biosynthesis regulator RodA [Terriglobales bacterium]